MAFQFRGVCLLATTLLVLMGCSKPHQTGPREKTFPLTGVVQVDGDPAEGLEVQCSPEPGSSKINYPLTATTDKNGAFSMATYKKGDGLPEGNYVLTFTWSEPGLVVKDRLKGKYADTKKSAHKVTVVTGKSNDLGEIELSTKK